MAARNPSRVCGTTTGSIRTLPKKSASIHLDRALAQSMLTMPKCSGPTFSTRGWRAPVGLWTSCRRSLRRRRAGREMAMVWTSTRGLMAQPEFSRGSPEMALDKIPLPDWPHTSGLVLCQGRRNFELTPTADRWFLSVCHRKANACAIQASRPVMGLRCPGSFESPPIACSQTVARCLPLVGVDSEYLVQVADSHHVSHDRVEP